MRKLAEKTKSARVDVGRRRLMTGAVSVGAAAGLGLANITAQAAPAPEQQPETRSAGYHETDHIRRYYRSAREI
ncbi:formate dehydrogenase [Wenzhouxiangella sp. C33]|uniref:Formate dehydrogenase n=2 Tax=Wenzhouxiangella limi TaxID=2707351 RepID=A0A845V350_9GAMM|nr:formate dehydrogenase [Wenzhouxiangella limi]